MSLTLGIFISCGTSKNQQQVDKDHRLSEKEFNVVSATINSWVGGIKGVKGYNLMFDVVGSNLDKLIIDSIWFYKDKAFKPKFEIISDTLKIEGSYSDSKKIVFRDVETGETKSAERTYKAPVDYTGDALIRAFYKDDEKYFIVESLKEIGSGTTEENK